MQVDDISTGADTRTRLTQTLGAAWGYHLVDVNVALGNLVTVVEQQIAAFG